MSHLLLLCLHLLAAGAWAGCVATEVFFERRLAAIPLRAPLADLHRRVDLWVELPALLLVAATGVAMLLQQVPTPWGVLLGLKLVLGGLAVLANLVCIRMVLERDAAQRADDDAAYRRFDALQHRWGAGVVLGLAGAILFGVGRLAAL